MVSGRRSAISDKVAKNVLATLLKEGNDGSDIATVAGLAGIKVICEAFCDMILNEVQEGNEVALTNFIKFKRVTMKPRAFNIPNSDQQSVNGKTVIKPERYALQVSIMAHTKKAFEAIPIVHEAEKSVPSDESDQTEVIGKADIVEETEEVEEEPKSKKSKASSPSGKKAEPKAKGKKKVPSDEPEEVEETKVDEPEVPSDEPKEEEVEKPKPKGTGKAGSKGKTAKK